MVLTTAGLQNLKRIEVIEDDKAQIIEAVRRMSERYDFVVTRQVL
jgi:molybdopterin-biosynthesis enzyme MoeA-like protein